MWPLSYFTSPRFALAAFCVWDPCSRGCNC